MFTFVKVIIKNNCFKVLTNSFQNDSDFFLSALGFASKTYQWKECKKMVKCGEDIEDHKNYIFKNSCRKGNHARAWIEVFADTQCDALPSIDGSLKDGFEVKCAPFESITAMYEEYITDNVVRLQTPTEQLALYGTFRQMYNSLKSKLRLMRCKNNFSTCELCVNAANLLAQQKKEFRAPGAREIIKKYRSMHLSQQLRQRVEMEKRLRVLEKSIPSLVNLLVSLC